MLKPGSVIAKMSETNILREYSSYLQKAILNLEGQYLYDLAGGTEIILTYEEFKNYYISTLVGKDDFLEIMVRDFQFSLS